MKTALDTAAMFGLLMAPAGINLCHTLNLPVLDGVASLVIGAILAGTAAFLAWKCQLLLTGEGASPEVQASIRTIAMTEPAVLRPNEVLTMHFGPQEVLVALSLDFDDRRSAAEVEQTVSRIEWYINAAHPEVTRVLVEAHDRDVYRQAEQSQASTLA